LQKSSKQASNKVSTSKTSYHPRPHEELLVNIARFDEMVGDQDPGTELQGDVKAKETE
jgi:hypothetical protein